MPSASRPSRLLPRLVLLAAFALAATSALPSASAVWLVGAGPNGSGFVATKVYTDLGPVVVHGDVEPDQDRPQRSSAEAGVCFGFDPETHRTVGIDSNGGRVVYFGFVSVSMDSQTTEPMDVKVPSSLVAYLPDSVPRNVQVPGTPGVVWGTYEAGYSDSDCGAAPGDAPQV